MEFQGFCENEHPETERKRRASRAATLISEEFLMFCGNGYPETKRNGCASRAATFNFLWGSNVYGEINTRELQQSGALRAPKPSFPKDFQGFVETGTRN